MASIATKSKLGTALIGAEIVGTVVTISGFFLTDPKKASTRKKIGVALFLVGWIGGMIMRKKK